MKEEVKHASTVILELLELIDHLEGTKVAGSKYQHAYGIIDQLKPHLNSTIIKLASLLKEE